MLPSGFRQKLVASAGFTSEESSSHLVGFGEWLAMYCIAWNPFLWPTLAVADTTTAAIPNELLAELAKDAARSPADAPRALGRPSPDAADAVITPLYGAPAENQQALQAAFERFKNSKLILDNFRREVARVRRLMANVPTYMICDDHEVTDDWFMTGGIRAKTTAKLFGRALLRNAIAAYTVCQAWGNDPARWSTDAQHQALLSGISGSGANGRWAN